MSPQIVKKHLTEDAYERFQRVHSVKMSLTISAPHSRALTRDLEAVRLNFLKTKANAKAGKDQEGRERREGRDDSGRASAASNGAGRGGADPGGEAAEGVDGRDAIIESSASGAKFGGIDARGTLNHRKQSMSKQ